MKNKRKFIFSLFMVSVILFVFPAVIFNSIFPLKYRKLIDETSEKYGLERELVASLIFIESKFNCEVKSSKGAMGLMQLMPTTAMAFSQDLVDIKDLYKPAVNIEIGCCFLAYLYEKYEDDVMVLACYNAGEGNVLKWVKNHDKLSLNDIEFKETYNYVKKILKCRKLYKYRIYS